MVSVKRRGPNLFEVRLQAIFLDATPEVLDEVAGMVAGRTGERPAIRGFVEASFSRNSRVAARFRTPAAPASGRGEHHDLVLYAAELNSLYLNGRSRAAVSWGRRHRRGVVRSIRFACYDPARNLIIMNRRLDSPAIPRHFVEFVLFHEMLHEVLGIGEKADGSRDIHGRVFKLMETTFPDFDKSLRFEKEFCRQLGIYGE